VGKSSLVTILSSGTPEICNYPFTTRSVKMGHFFVDQTRHQVRSFRDDAWRHFAWFLCKCRSRLLARFGNVPMPGEFVTSVVSVQVTDTPGLLDRPLEERNAMELLTLATLQHLPTAALFVMDLTEECGCSVQQQWRTRAQVLQEFPDKLWIDIISKADMLEEELDYAAELGHEQVPDVDAVPKNATQAVRPTFLVGILGSCKLRYVLRTTASWQKLSVWLRLGAEDDL
jgi:nucleolar GTP-binding protein